VDAQQEQTVGDGFRVTDGSYGKSAMRVMTSVSTPDGDRVRVLDLSIDVSGDFLESYREGDNRRILPSDTLRRHALAACAASPVAGAAELVAEIGRRVLAANDAFGAVTVHAEHEAWDAGGRLSFVRVAGGCASRATIRRAGAGFEIDASGSIRGLELLSTRGSAFAGFLRDALTTQTDAADRPLCGELDATWTHAAGADAPTEPERVAEHLIDACADRSSNAIQQLLTAVAAEVLRRVADLSSISLRFAGLPIVPIPAELLPPDLRASTAPRCFEIGTGPVGISEVTLARR